MHQPASNTRQQPKDARPTLGRPGKGDGAHGTGIVWREAGPPLRDSGLRIPRPAPGTTIVVNLTITYGNGL
jgi:hypothetical protein